MGRSRRRDRHGRGTRGPLLPPYARGREQVRLPAWRTRADAFDRAVLQAVGRVVERVVERFPELAQLALGVQDVPPQVPAGTPGVVTDGDGVPLARAVPGAPPQLVVYRRPVELRAQDPVELAQLLHEVAVDAVADLLGLDPEQVDPGQG